MLGNLCSVHTFLISTNTSLREDQPVLTVRKVIADPLSPVLHMCQTSMEMADNPQPFFIQGEHFINKHNVTLYPRDTGSKIALVILFPSLYIRSIILQKSLNSVQVSVYPFLENLLLSSTICFYLFFSWSIIALQCYVSFCCRTMRLNEKYTYITSLWSLPDP